jgi:hypothetical protein
VPTFVHGSKGIFKIADAGSVMRDISNVLKSEGLPRSADTADTSALGTTSKTYIPGMFDGTISIDGMYDVTVDGYLAGILGLMTTYEYYPTGTGVTNVKYSGACLLTSYETTSGVDDAAKITGEIQLSGPVTRTVL